MSEPPPSAGHPPPSPAPPSPSPVGPAAPSVGGPVPQDADDTRGMHFRRLLGGRVALIGGGVLVVGAFVVGSLAAGPGVGGLAALGAALLVVVVAWLVAFSRAAADFFRAYAAARGLSLSDERDRPPPVTPLLRKGDKRYRERTMRGTLPGGLPGSLALYTYEEKSTDSKGNTRTTYHHFTIALCELPELAPFVAELFCQRRAGFRFLDSAEDVFRRSQRVEVESEAADRRYEIFCGGDDDLNRVRQVFSPTFIVWLAENAPEDFAFELVAGVLVCNVKGHERSAAELDALCNGAAAVARRMLEEAAE